MKMEDNHRPWGFYEILSDQDDHKVKRITVNSGKRLSLQKHKKRAEHWYVVKGEAIVTLDTQLITLSEGDHVDIGMGMVHRVENKGDKDLVFIEVQVGEYFGEDDIERLEDDFGRL